MNTEYRGDYLPYGQPPIYTSNVKCLIDQVNEWWSCAEQFPAPLGLAVGAPGAGKTSAAHCYLLRREPEQRPRCAIVTVMPHMTQKSMLASILHQFGVSSRGHSFYEMASRLQDVSRQGHPPLLVLDDADYFLDDAGYLKPEFLEILPMLVNHSSCFVLLVGVPKLLASIEMVPRLECRVGLIHHIEPLSDAEAYELFLPHLVVPGWGFDGTNEEDLCIGHYLWENARPSLRRVRMILDVASYLAQTTGSGKITFETIRMAVKNS